MLSLMTPLPDFRNLGVMLRVLLLTLLLLCADGLLALGAPEPLWHWLQTALAIVPGSLLTLALLALAHPWLARQRLGPLWALALTGGSFALCQYALRGELGQAWAAPWVAALAAALLLHYLSLRQRALSPALAEARLAALQARIRPHFLFNTLNAAIALIRLQPAKAESVLENLSDLFRAQMADPARASTLAREVELARMYLAIESERLGPRLRVAWQLDAALPPLILQPLVENAVYHGAERLAGEVEIRVAARLAGGLLELALDNPVPDESDAASPGSGMALSNLRERLALFFDAEASLATERRGERYHTRLRLPYRRAAG
ncbi:histidine kinase [Chromobacterium phragmitis]|uniref:sensor histidine kinase n=1 Tax=Chromobacterium amazonense TaxID=1382803 RepID=UPI0021B6F672|nr:histidine kinase [Chromobacterium amazonense]MBM2886014.1 histidine kinase [Chromobacterium amazonense]